MRKALHPSTATSDDSCLPEDAHNQAQSIVARNLPRPTARLLGLSILSLAFLWIAACVDLSAVRAIATASQQASAPFRQIAVDMPASCLRAEALRPPDSRPGGACAKLETAKPPLLAVQDVLDGYFDVLGQLASDQPVSFEKPLDQIAAAVKNGTKVPADKIDAVDGLAKYLADLATRAIREAGLKDVISAQNDNVQKVLQAQKTIAGTDYRQLLINEGKGLEYRYDVPPELRTREKLLTILVDDRWQETRAVLSTRLAAIDTYEKALDGVARAHQRLYDHRDDLGEKALASALLAEAKKLSALGKQIEKAF